MHEGVHRNRVAPPSGAAGYPRVPLLEEVARTRCGRLAASINRDLEGCDLTHRDSLALSSLVLTGIASVYYFLAFKYSQIPRYILWTNFMAGVFVVLGFDIMVTWSPGVRKALLGPGMILRVISVFLR